MAMVREMERVGPNMAEVARRVKAPKETVSYAFRQKLLKGGYSLHARADRGAMGLMEIDAVVDVNDEFADSAEHVFDGMDERWFLHDFARTLPEGKYILGFTLPEEHYDEFPRLLEGMSKAGLISKVDHTLRISWRRIHPMRAELFDFKRGRWEFDWSQNAPRELPEIPPRTERQRLDSIDIRILGYMNTDATISIKEIAKRMGVSSKTAYRHTQHIFDKHLILGYRIGWIKTQMNAELGRPFAPQHKYAFMAYNVLEATAEEQARLSERLNRLPFIIGEGGGRDYVAELAIPLEQLVETVSYLREALQPVAKKSRSYIIDVSCARTYNPPGFLVDHSTGGWAFDLEAQMALLEQRIEAVRGEGRSANPVRSADATSAK